ncbi:hypothetical protein METBIDRAFT_13262 [Metschnikowia bicuspidata var. bicuspidata NRRL YB-4993]|uniref:Uncharacterized protein n=1 Tax=Metschnikowia bicuspidata var. bicuspidata NRRL YB-4993 TaxID=869754 RepID=A0A1A0H6G8_9ASCO|nr:hypothetical protein METBIDRAFT_13262 [Metschnikowia bicuspidata var. bicuspidata NRRL YB-4993]OBA19502.1 hypothetical protein METBIDRAFT_13262 [Metschnikowia bicuspidata var. bicuspidata NRRL YB-4993]
MSFKQGICAFIFLLSLSHSLFIPLDAISQLRVKLLAREHASPPTNHFAQGFDVVAPEVKQLFVIFEKITNQTESELMSMFDSQDHALALVSLKFWAQLIKTFFVSDNALLLSLVTLFQTQNLFQDILESVPEVFKQHLENLDHVEPDSDSLRVPLPSKSTDFILDVQQSKGLTPDPDKPHEIKVSYETLQKWIDDYGLSASSLRDYLETYLFAGDLLWVAGLSTEAPENEPDEKPDLELRERLAILGANIQSALHAPSIEAEEIEGQEVKSYHSQPQRLVNEHVKQAVHKPFRFEDPDLQVKENDESHSGFVKRSRMGKRSIDELPDYGSLIYAFSRLDANDPSAESGRGFEKEFENDELALTLLKHRVFENDEIVEPTLALSLEEPYARSKDYRQVVYDAFPLDDRIVRRDDKEAEKDCVPVTWYNVFHYSIFGKHKFCHV